MIIATKNHMLTNRKTLSMKRKYLFILILTFVASLNFAQEAIMVEYDFITKDSTIINFGESNLNQDNASTLSFIGNARNVIPLGTLEPNNNFVRIENVEQTSSYPISTSVRIESVDGQEEYICSGTMISSRHILTSAACFLSQRNHTIETDSILVFPGYNDGQENPLFGSHLVTKAYSFLNWTFGNDFMILEIDEDIGAETGWIGVAFNNNKDELLNQVYHKYSYPSSTMFIPFDGEINGDTLYYSYGLYDRFNPPTYVGSFFPDPKGFLGELGSSFFLPNAKDDFEIYGTLAWSSSFGHSIIDEFEFWGIANIIEPFLTTATSEIENVDFEIYPNPTDNIINIEMKNFEQSRTTRTNIHSLRCDDV